jgi:hypothetical protein
VPVVVSSKCPYQGSVLVCPINFVPRVIGIPFEGDLIRDALVNVNFRGNYGIPRIAFLDEVQISTIQAAVMACVQDIVADVGCVVSYPIQIAVRRVSCERTFAVADISTKDQTSIMKLASV